MKKLLWFIRQSLLLDIRFSIENKLSFGKKIEFIILKYRLILMHIFKQFHLSYDYCTINNTPIYYDSKYGIAGLQRALVSHKHLLQFIKEKNIKKVIDIGANVGYFSYVIHDLYPKAIIHAFEPIPLIFECLKKNAKFFGQIYINNGAISNTNGKLRMTYYEKNSAESHIDPKGNIQVKTETLDKYISAHNIKAIDILKIDTEGFEDAVLDGAKNALAITDYIYMEVSITGNSRYTISRLLGKLYSKKYNFQLIAMRNFEDTGEGEVPIMDCLFVNTKKNIK